ncbi:tetratricopeptide repeat protein [Hymenobacter arizonensis]|uniref:Tetratricopeptide repeat-containing protein n=1 Tax=Hymenobacter arizonensis TaxID=1227077 RepID=A0A1I5ZS03_HYMAR|nr:tetratricopeptide repeat protein [Hymenobacter arizonensis]SFQ59238.1 Tetratricopeptide repeat-containing protein [Hymenobacter arizonensis]
MTRYEKFLLFLLLFLVVLQATEITPRNSFLWLCIWLLALSYIVGGRWLFKDRKVFSTSFYVLAGICLGTSLVSLSFTLRARHESFEVLLPALNGVFCFGLGIYLFRQRAQKQDTKALRGLWWRSAVLLALAGFFAFSPITLAPYRVALLAFNRGDDYITSNLLMHNYRAAAQAAIAEGNYSAAISNAQKSYIFGNRWLGSDSITSKSRISGAYTLLYEAHEGRGDAAYAKQEFHKALEDYRQGHFFLISSDNREDGVGEPNSYWEEEKAWSFRKMADCHLRLKEFTACDSLYVAALKAYKVVNPKPDLHRARIANGLARSFAAQGEPDASTKIYRELNLYLATDSTRDAALELQTNRVRIVGNYIWQDSLFQALRDLQAISFALNDTSKARFEADMYRGICLTKIGKYADADYSLRIPWRFYQQRAERNWVSLATVEMLLANNSLAQGHYPKAKVLASSALARIKQERGANNLAYAQGLRILGALNKELGQYSEAGQQLRQVLNTVQKAEGDASATQPIVLAQIAEMDLIMGYDVAALATMKQAISLLTAAGPVKLPSQTGVFATAAYVDYATGNQAAAQTKYRQVLAINARFQQGQTATSAAAWNGLGLVATSQHRFERADSLLTKAVALHEALFTKQNPLTGTVYLNLGQLRLQQGRTAEAEQLFQQALRIAQSFLPAQHDKFGDLAMAFGDLAVQQRQLTTAHMHYQQALGIYSHTFGIAHWKTRLAQQKVTAQANK